MDARQLEELKKQIRNELMVELTRGAPVITDPMLVLRPGTRVDVEPGSELLFIMPKSSEPKTKRRVALF